MTGIRILALAALAGLAAACGKVNESSGVSHDHAAHAALSSAPAPGSEQQALVVFSDAAMFDQTGAERHLQSDVIGSRIVVVDFIFTSCQTICPVTTSLLAEARGRLKDVPAEDLVFISMSVDSAVDTPERLAAFAASRKADWTFLTGDKPVMDEALTLLNAYSTNPENHTAMILIGDAATNRFSRIYGMPDPDFVEARVRELIAARAQGASLHSH
jgi:protein SCO1/2